VRIAHVISEYSAHEAMGRTIAETAARVPGTHHLVTARLHDGAEGFDRATSIGGSLSWFAWQRASALTEVLDGIEPDVVHLHGGALTPLWATSPALRHRLLVQTIYGWPRLPGPGAIRLATPAQLCRSNVVRPRVLVSTALPRRAAVSLLRRSRTSAVLSPDPAVLDRLSGVDVPVHALPSGAAADPRRAAWQRVAPTVVFAGRSEAVRGIDTLLDAFVLVRRTVTDARLRLMLIPTAELAAIRRAVDRSGLDAAVEVVTEPVADLAEELARAQVGVWPFKFDYTTSPPAMAVAEAMAVGLPVVSTPVACVRAIAQDGRNADLVPVADHPTLATAITKLLVDRELWYDRARAGLETVAGPASWVAAAEVVHGIYRRALGCAEVAA
jgi:alpha-maltose-1-phosphate synthase